MASKAGAIRLGAGNVKVDVALYEEVMGKLPQVRQAYLAGLLRFAQQNGHGAPALDGQALKVLRQEYQLVQQPSARQTSINQVLQVAIVKAPGGACTINPEMLKDRVSK